MKNQFVLLRKVVHWKGRKYIYHVPMKGKTTADPGIFYCPYIPLFRQEKAPQ